MKLPLILTLAACTLTPASIAASPEATGALAPEAVVESEKALEYISDFFCFVGSDEQGKVAFAFDVNRGRKDDDYQAQTIANLWVDGEGWEDFGGMVDFDDPEDRFYELPSSSRWSLEGWASTGVTIRSQRDGIELEVDPIATHTKNKRGLAVFTSGSSAGTLRLGEREITGRVSHEYCFLSDMNPLAKRYTDLFGDGFDGIYAVLGEGGDLRFHESGGRLEPLVMNRDGFVVEEGEASRIEGASFKVSDKSFGLIRWPGRYRSSWTEDGVACSYDLRIRDRETLVNVVIVGVAVGIVEGTYTRGGVEQEVFGMALIVR
ncbi:MAG: hypothetical protein AAFZ65_08315 [Planctomycetota bacterium]